MRRVRGGRPVRTRVARVAGRGRIDAGQATCTCVRRDAARVRGRRAGGSGRRSGVGGARSTTRRDGYRARGFCRCGGLDGRDGSGMLDGRCLACRARRAAARPRGSMERRLDWWLRARRRASPGAARQNRRTSRPFVATRPIRARRRGSPGRLGHPRVGASVVQRPDHPRPRIRCAEPSWRRDRPCLVRAESCRRACRR